MKTQPIKPSVDRRIQVLFPVALASLLLVGTARLILDTLKSNHSYAFRLQHPWRGQKRKLPIVLSPNDRLEESCNVFEGKWVWDNVSYPYYTEESCPYLVKQTTCLRNGRPDSLYQNWKWQPNDCKLPRLDAFTLLELLRGKRLMFVGDSVQRAQFESMICLVQSVIPDGKKSLRRVPPMKIFRAEEYDASIEYYWAPFIVESISDHATNHTVHKRLVSLDSIDNHGKHWEGVDILVFESYVWWMHKPQINATYGSRDNVKEYNVTSAYKLAMETWANWIESKINANNQKVFFMSMSPTHLWSWEWNPGSDENCYNESYPIQHQYWGTGSNLEIMQTLQDVIQELRINVTLLNITQLSEYRKDAHTSVYGERRGKLLTKELVCGPKITFCPVKKGWEWQALSCLAEVDHVRMNSVGLDVHIRLSSVMKVRRVVAVQTSVTLKISDCKEDLMRCCCSAVSLCGVGMDSSKREQDYTDGSLLENLSAKDYKERLRRIKIGLANKGKVPWNKGKRHSAETCERIKHRTIEALRDPKVKKKMVEQPRRHSDETKAKIGYSLRQIWSERLKENRLKEQYFLLWAESIAEAAKEGGDGEQELDWNSYENIKKELALQRHDRDVEKAKLKQIKAEKAAQRKAEKLAKHSEKRRMREEKTKARKEMKMKTFRKSMEEKKLKERLTKIHKKKPLHNGVSNCMTTEVSHFHVWEKLDLELMKKETLHKDTSLADQIRAAKSKRTESIFSLSSSSCTSNQKEQVKSTDAAN